MRQATRAAGRFQVAAPGGRVVPGHLQQVGPDGVEPVPAGDPLVAGQGYQQVQPGVRASAHGHGDGVVQRHHRRRSQRE